MDKGTSITHLAFGPGKGKGGIIVAAAGSTLLWMSASSCQVLERVEGAHRGGITALELGPGQTTVVASAGLDKAVRLWRLPQDSG